MFIFFACPKKKNQKKRLFSQGIPSSRINRDSVPKSFSKTFPMLQNFLTKMISILRENEKPPAVT